MFKKGDKVRRVQGDFGVTVEGEVYEVESHIGGNLKLVFGGIHTYDPDCFELVKSKPVFDMKKECWYIRIESKEQYHLVEAWLEENFGATLGLNYSGGMKFLSNVRVDSDIPQSRVMWTEQARKLSTAAKEIVLNFKTTIDSVEYPEVESATQKKIRELEESALEMQENARKLQEQIAELKKLEE